MSLDLSQLKNTTSGNAETSVNFTGLVGAVISTPDVDFTELELLLEFDVVETLLKLLADDALLSEDDCGFVLVLLAVNPPSPPAEPPPPPHALRRVTTITVKMVGILGGVKLIMRSYLLHWATV